MPRRNHSPRRGRRHAGHLQAKLLRVLQEGEASFGTFLRRSPRGRRSCEPSSRQEVGCTAGPVDERDVNDWRAQNESFVEAWSWFSLHEHQARTTEDVDLRVMGSPDEILGKLQAAGRRDLGDFTTVDVSPHKNHPASRRRRCSYTRQRPTSRRSFTPSRCRADIRVSRDPRATRRAPAATAIMSHSL